MPPQFNRFGRRGRLRAVPGRPRGTESCTWAFERARRPPTRLIGTNSGVQGGLRTTSSAGHRTDTCRRSTEGRVGRRGAAAGGTSDHGGDGELAGADRAAHRQPALAGRRAAPDQREEAVHHRAGLGCEGLQGRGREGRRAKGPPPARSAHPTCAASWPLPTTLCLTAWPPPACLPAGEERTRRELIPFVNESVDDEDEILLALAEELGEFVPLVGGPQHAHFLLPPLEALATVDETVVRERAVASICGVTAQMPAGSVQEHLLPLLQVRGQGWAVAGAVAVGCWQWRVWALQAAALQTLPQLQTSLGPLLSRQRCTILISRYVQPTAMCILPAAYLPAFQLFNEPCCCWRLLAAEAGGAGMAGAGVGLQALRHSLPPGAGGCRLPACRILRLHAGAADPLPNCQQPRSALELRRTFLPGSSFTNLACLNSVCRNKAGVSCVQPSSSSATTRRPWSGERRRRCGRPLSACTWQAACLAVHCPWQPSRDQPSLTIKLFPM